MKCELCQKEVESVESVRVAGGTARKLCAPCVQTAVEALQATSQQQLFIGDEDNEV